MDSQSVLKHFTESVEEDGYKVLFGTEECSKYRETHENCEGCPSFDGCQRLAAMLTLFAKSLK
ncbi:hypothetical protein EDC14_10166 [Hydrogenispora ethanolica]|uniref:Uncharacterized protein n=1 Tax=Hydrogenispora ethanolica TaxID=1082276 RepID=A0A4V2QDZ3_HYDET|nr:hypothetical protein [Hydrogenispora ethanolica]TCL65877.1 hypothetical protein EDC14_10166 [Hydrogenispora ethanolica]